MIEHPIQKPLVPELYTTRPFPNYNYLLYCKWLIPLMIILSVFLFNLPYLFMDTLWHDDGLWYWKATQGMSLNEIFSSGKVATLAPYRHYLYSYGMVYLGLPFTRGVFALIMAVSSLALYYLYRNAFGIDSKVAMPAAIIPNILPSLIGMPAGLNTSYAMWGLLPVLASLILMLKAFALREAKSLVLVGFAFAFYAIGLNLTEAANFLIPCVLFFFLMFFPVNRTRTLIYGLPFLIYGLWQIYKQYLFTHLQPTGIPQGEIINRLVQFLKMASFLPFNQSSSLYITIGLSILGMTGLLSMNSMIYRQPVHFNYNRNAYRLLLFGWPICWIIANSIVYITTSPTFDPFRYAYVFNFGAVFLQVVGLVYLIVLLCQMMRIHTRTKVNGIISVFVAGVILFTGIQKVQNKNDKFGPIPKLEKASKVIREKLSGIPIPEGSQIIILGMSSQHSGNVRVNSGYLRYLLNRRDVTGVIGPDKYPNNIFLKIPSWFDIMCGLDPQKPVIAYRVGGDSLVRVNLMLQVVSTGEKVLPRLQWSLYDISSFDGPPHKLATGNGLSSYNNYILNDLPHNLRGADIAFAPHGEIDKFVDAARADRIAENGGIIDAEINFGNHFTLRNVSAAAVENGYKVEALVRVDSIPIKPFKLGYSLIKDIRGGRGVSVVSLWDFAFEGDHLLLSSPVVSAEKLRQGIPFLLVNAGKWPFQPLVIQGGKYDGTKVIKLSWEPDSTPAKDSVPLN